MTIEQGAFSWLIKQGVDWLGKGRLPKTSGRMRLGGLSERVEVIRDRWGVPHIYAANEPDLFFAQGFVHAQDRFWQMEFQRRVVSGRLAELVGDAGIEIDRWMRTVGIYAIARQEYEQLAPAVRQVLDAYTAGVNIWLKHSRPPVEFVLLRSEPERWSAVDSLAWSKMMAWTMSGNWEAELVRQQLIAKLGPLRADALELQGEDSWPIVLIMPHLLQFQKGLAAHGQNWDSPGPGEGVGSNNWVVGGARTATGKPILANDMHLMLSTPAIWYENHLAGGDLQVSGISLPGLPLVVCGHTESVAWGFTAGMGDVQDLYEEHLRQTPEGSVEYEYQGEWLPAEVRQEEICVRAKASVTEKVIITRHGPIITPLVADETQLPLALRWTVSEFGDGTFQAMLNMHRAKNCVEFHEALRSWKAPVLNVVYADTAGNIGYTLAGQLPIRAKGFGKVPVPGWSGDYEWIGKIPFDEMPRVLNPPAGYICTANNRTVGPDYPYFLGRDYVTGDRAARIIELILKQPIIDLEYVKQMQLDQVSNSAQMIAGLVGQLNVDDPQLVQGVNFLRAWDGTLAVDSPAAAIYEVLVREILWVIFQNRLGDFLPRFSGEVLYEVAGTNIWAQHAWGWLYHELQRVDLPWFDLGSGEVREDVLRLALERTIKFLRKEQGLEMSTWSWGFHHKLTFQHALGRIKPLDEIFNRGPYPVGGDHNTVWATATMLDRVDSSDGMVGPPSRFIIDLADFNRSLSILAPGQSGQVGSPHYADQVEAWFKGEYHPMLFDRDAVLAAQEACLELLP